jgi:integrase/recombinase XerD
MRVKYNTKNEIIKARYFEHLKEAKQRSESTINAVSKALLRYEEFNNFDEIEKLTRQKAIDFKTALLKAKNKAKNQQLSKSTILHTINPLKDFFIWLHQEQGFKKKIKLNDIQYFNLSANDMREAKATENRPIPTIEIIRHVLTSIKIKNDIDRRNQALIAFMLLTGVRDGAVITLKLKHVDIGRKLVKQDPREVKTKNSKQIDTYFFPVGDDIEKIVVDWIRYRMEVNHCNLDDPLFPKTEIGLDAENSFKNMGLSKEHWKSASAVVTILKQCFADAGHDYYHPHSFRKTIVQFGEQLCRTPEEFKAWSQNIGHESPLTTFISYGYVDVHRQGDIITNLGKGDRAENEIMALLKKIDLKL